MLTLRIRRILWIILAISWLLWGISKIYLLYSNKIFSSEEIGTWFEPITSKYNIKVVYEINDDFFSPLQNPPIPAGPSRYSEVSPIRHRVLARYPGLLLNAFEKYPIRVIESNLKAINFAGEINQAGFYYSGSYDPFAKIIYLVDDGSKFKKDAIKTFHHEFSSLLLKSHSFFVNPWEDINPKNFQYLGNIYDAWEDLEKNIDLSRELSETDYKNGFVSVYGQTNFENDFNEYSAMIFTYPDKFREIMNKYPRVRGKFLVWLEFYQKIDPIFTEEYLFKKE